jgi:hypothetical protein
MRRRFGQASTRPASSLGRRRRLARGCRRPGVSRAPLM